MSYRLTKLRPQTQGARMHPRDQGVRSLNGFPIGVEEHRVVRMNRQFAHAAGPDAALLVKPTEEE